jgi:hypothetical protein
MTKLDFSQFNSRKGGSTPGRMQTRNPADYDDLLTNEGEPCIVLVYGAECPEVEEALKANERKRAKKPKGNAEEELREDTKILIAGFENIYLDGKALTNSEEDKDKFLGLQRMTGQAGQKSFTEQINEYSLNRKNHLGNGSEA